MLCWCYIAVADAMSETESIRTVWDWKIGGDRYYYEMPAFDSVHAEWNSNFVIICGRLFMKVQLVLQQIWAKLWKNGLSSNVEESFKKFLDAVPETDDFLVQRYILGNSFRKIQ